MQTLGEFEYSQGDILGHGAFALVFKGRRKKGECVILQCKLLLCVTVLVS